LKREVNMPSMESSLQLLNHEPLLPEVNEAPNSLAEANVSALPEEQRSQVIMQEFSREQIDQKRKELEELGYGSPTKEDVIDTLQREQAQRQWSQQQLDKSRKEEDQQ
jgi:hypothetical protein